MNEVIRSLLWKEWHEHRWKLVFGCVILMGVAAIGLKTRMVPDEIIVVFVNLIGAFALPLFMAMGLVATERADGSFNSLLALPVRPKLVFWLKIAVGALGCAAPLIGAAIVTLVIAGGRELPLPHLARLYVTGIGFGLVMLIWTVVFSVRQPSEARVGLVGIGVVMAWGLLVIVADEIIAETFIARPWDRLSLVITPFGFFEWGLDRATDVFLVFWVQPVLAVGLLIWAANRFAKPGRTRA